MTVLIDKEIQKVSVEYSMITPFSERMRHESGMSYGLSFCGYDIRLGEDVELTPFALGVSIEKFKIPYDVVAFVKDKSSLIRTGISAGYGVLEPGWEGYLTLEIVDFKYGRRGTGFWSRFKDLLWPKAVTIKKGTPIAQIVFLRLTEPVAQPYTGNYQNQINQPVKSVLYASG